MKKTLEHHPDWFYSSPKMKTLILGTFPPHQRHHRYPFYYPNKQNRFWPVLAKIAGVELKAQNPEDMVRERKEILNLLKVGIHNVGKSIWRKGQSSLDTDIEIVEYHDLLGLIDAHPKLEAIIISGLSPKHGTASAFRSYLEVEKIDMQWPKKFSVGDEFLLKRGVRTIHCHIVNSTSRAAFKVTFEMLEQQFGRILKPESYPGLDTIPEMDFQGKRLP